MPSPRPTWAQWTPVRLAPTPTGEQKPPPPHHAPAGTNTHCFFNTDVYPGTGQVFWLIVNTPPTTDTIKSRCRHLLANLSPCYPFEDICPAGLQSRHEPSNPPLLWASGGFENHSTASMGKRGGSSTPKQLQLQQAAALVTFQPQGKGPRKRTPRTIAEQQELAQEDFFEPAAAGEDPRRVHGQGCSAVRSSLGGLLRQV